MSEELLMAYPTPWVAKNVGTAGLQNEVMVYDIVDARGNRICTVAGTSCARLIVVAVNQRSAPSGSGPDKIIASIVEDIRGRKGIGDEWDNIDPDTLFTIITKWRGFF